MVIAKRENKVIQNSNNKSDLQKEKKTKLSIKS